MTNGTGTTEDLSAEELVEAQVQSKRIEEYSRTFPRTIDLLYPVQAQGETIASVTLQLPTGMDLWHAGDPFSEGPGKPANLRVLITLLSRLAAVPESSIKRFSVPDLKTIEAALLPLFAPSAEKLKDMLSILRTSSETSGE
jgi:hypothetical protein